MGLFQELEGDVAILVSNGVYKQVPLYKRDGYLFAKSGGGFVRLHADGATSQASVRIDTLSIEGALYKDPLGRLAIDPRVPKAVAIEPATAQKLLGAN